MTRILGFLKPLKKYVVLSILFVLLSQGVGLLLPLLMSMIINNGISKMDSVYITTVGRYMVAAAGVSLVLAVCNSYYTSKLSTLFAKNLREKVFFKVEGLSQCDIDKIGTSSLITRSTNDIKQLQDFLLTGVRMILAAPIMLIGGTIMAFVMNAKLAMYVFVILPIICILAALIIKLVVPLFRRRQRLTDRLNHLVREKLSGIRVIRAFNRTAHEDERFDEGNGELADIAQKIARIFSVLIPFCIVLIFSGVCLLIWAAARNIDAMDAVLESVKISNTIGDLQAFLIYMLMIVASLTMAGAMFVIVPRASISAKRVLEILDLVPEIKPSEQPLSVDEDKKGTVDFVNVSFGYPGAEDSVLKNISFTAEKGQTTAIIGGTGSGKSTLINLIPRFYDVTEGKVLFDGVDVRELDEDDLHSRIGFIPQSATLFSGTIGENVRFGDAEADDEKVWAALRVAQAEDFVRELPEKLSSHVSQSGTNLSGGQKQRLSIARAVIKDAEVYIFDDSFSALDFKTDALLRQAVSKQLSNAAVIVVAQRVGTILGAEKIVVLDEGKIAGIGTHRQLIDSCKVYREIVESQLSAEEYSAV